MSTRYSRRLPRPYCRGDLCPALISTSFAAEIPPAPVAGDERAAPGINTGDNAWLLVSSALVLMMTAPGLILFYGGLVRQQERAGAP